MVQKLIFLLMFVVGKCHSVIYEYLKIGHDTILWSNRLKYLGVCFKAGHTFLIDNEMIVWKFHTAANAIYSHVKFASEVMVLF